MQTAYVKHHGPYHSILTIARGGTGRAPWLVVPVPAAAQEDGTLHGMSISCEARDKHSTSGTRYYYIEE